MRSNRRHEQSSGGGASPQPWKLSYKVALGAALVFIPLLIGILTPMVVRQVRPQASLPPLHESAFSAAARTHELQCATNRASLLSLRHQWREQGLDTGELDWKVWALAYREPMRLFYLEPPDQKHLWYWCLSSDGLYAVASTLSLDMLERRRVALYELSSGRKLWENTLLWPDSHNEPDVLDSRLFLRYSQNALRKVMELDNQGRVIHIDTLEQGQEKVVVRPKPDPRIAGIPVAVKSGVYFVSDHETMALSGYARCRAPGLYPIGKLDDNSTLSGNGLLKFTVMEGEVHVFDALTQKLLRKFDGWPHATNTVVSGMQVTSGGAHLSIFLTTEFMDARPIKRSWLYNLNVYTGKKELVFEEGVAPPRRRSSREVALPNQKWSLRITDHGTLAVDSLEARQLVAELPLPELGIEEPVVDIYLLEDGRHLVMRLRNELAWLLDIQLALDYGNLLVRYGVAEDVMAESRLGSKRAHGGLDPAQAIQAQAEKVAWNALQSEYMAAHQAWIYAADLLRKADGREVLGKRAAYVNGLQLARLQTMAGVSDKARQTARQSLLELSPDQSETGRMVRFQLQGIYFMVDEPPSRLLGERPR